MRSTYTFIIVALIVIGIAAGGWWVWRNSSGDLANISADTERLSDAQAQQVIARIGQFMVIPTDEKPSIAVVHDVTTLAQRQSFYADAKDGDVLVVYSTRAIIYDPKSDKLVNVGPIARTETTVSASLSADQAGASVSPTPSVAPEKATVDVRNGTSQAGLAGTTVSSLKKNSWVTNATATDASGTYTATVLVDRTAGKKPGALAALETLFSAKAVQELPKGEATSTADFVVILGK